MVKEQLKRKIIRSLSKQGFSVNGSVVPLAESKSAFKKIHSDSRIEQIILQKDFILDNLDTVSKYFVDGKDINPANIELELREAKEGTLEQIIFRWWNLVWWSVPHQKAYGRQMRFVLWDKTHNAPFGLIGLQSPVLKMSVRDNFLEIPNKELDFWVNQSMQAQRLGALPPYNRILGGKMVALALTSSQLRRAYKKKYTGVKTLMQGRYIEPELLFITTTSAFGRSSIYNRLKYDNELVAQSLGYTKGSGSFHIPQELYEDILKFLRRRREDVGTTFGNGPSRKIKLLDKAFGILDLRNYTYHNIKREFFFFPLAKNCKNVIHKNSKPKYYSRNIDDLATFWKERWAVPRSERMDDWKQFNAKNFITGVKRNITRWSK